MVGHGEKLSRKQEAAIAALLTAGSIEKAAAVAKIGTTTLRRWLTDPDFSDAYRCARAQALEGAVGRLHGTLGAALDTLERLMACGKEAVELGAARTLLEQGFRAAELLDLAERVEALEEASVATSTRAAANGLPLYMPAPSRPAEREEHHHGQGQD
jgi:hypothetical protein